METIQFGAAFGATATATADTLVVTLPADDSAHLALVQELALELMEWHGLRPGKPGGWTLRWSRAREEAGHCDYERREISLTARLLALWPVSQCRDTILHEIAHALAPYHGHDEVWVRQCLKVGANPESCYDAAALPTLPKPPPKYTGRCPNGHVHTRRRISRRTPPESCLECAPRYDEDYLITWTQAQR